MLHDGESVWFAKFGFVRQLVDKSYVDRRLNHFDDFDERKKKSFVSFF